MSILLCHTDKMKYKRLSPKEKIPADALITGVIPRCLRAFKTFSELSHRGFGCSMHLFVNEPFRRWKYIYMSTSHYPDLSIIEVPRREKLSEALRSLTTLYKPSRRIAIDHPSIVSYSLSYGGVQSTYLQPIPDFTESPCNVETGKHRCISRCIFLWFEREFRNSSENRLRWKANPHSWPFVRSIGFVPHPMK